MYKTTAGPLTRKEKDYIRKATTLPATSIDDTLQDMVLALNDFANNRDLVRNVLGGSRFGMTFDTKRIDRWQKTLTQLEHMDDDDPHKRKYDHFFLQRVAEFFGVNYDLPAYYASAFPT